MIRGVLAAAAALVACAPVSAATIVRTVNITPALAGGGVTGEAVLDPFSYATGDVLDITLVFTAPATYNMAEPYRPILSITLSGQGASGGYVASGDASTTFALANPVGPIQASGGVSNRFPSTFGQTFLDVEDGPATGPTQFDGARIVYQITRGDPTAVVSRVRFEFFGTPAAIPEPASWAMMIAGFGLVGGAARRVRAAPGKALA